MSFQGQIPPNAAVLQGSQSDPQPHLHTSQRHYSVPEPGQSQYQRNVCCFLDNNISFAKFCKDARMLVTQMDRYPPGVIGVIQSEEPRNNVGQCVYVEQEVSLSYHSHVEHHLQFQLQGNGPKQEERTGFNPLITSVFK